MVVLGVTVITAVVPRVVVPDVQVPGRWDEVDPENDPALNKAIEILEKAK